MIVIKIFIGYRVAIEPSDTGVCQQIFSQLC